MNSAGEEAFWKSAGVKSVSELPDFPFSDYWEFLSAIRDGDASVGIKHSAARELAEITKPTSAAYVLYCLGCWTPFLFVPASIVVGVFTGSWGNLVGIPAALTSIALASPYNPLRRLVLLGAFASLVYCLFAGTILTVGTWSAFAFGLSIFAVRFLNWLAWRWAFKAILGSEALTAYLWKTASLTIKGKEFGITWSGRV